MDTQPKLCKYENMFATAAVRPLQTLSALGSRARSFSSVNPRVPVVNRPSARRHARVQASICPIIDTKKCVREWRVESGNPMSDGLSVDRSSKLTHSSPRTLTARRVSRAVCSWEVLCRSSFHSWSASWTARRWRGPRWSSRPTPCSCSTAVSPSFWPCCLLKSASRSRTRSS